MRNRNVNGLYLLLALYIVASMTFFIAEVAAGADQVFHSSEHVYTPFLTNWGDINTLRPEAKEAGLAADDFIESLNGRPYAGRTQLLSIIRNARPGDILQVRVRTTKGAYKTAAVRLQGLPVTKLAELVGRIVLIVLFPLACSLLGYWVVAAKPREPNAWLILLLLGFPELLFLYPNWWSGGWLAFLDLWFQVFQLVSPPALLLFGIYFPERWRLDKKLPWVKWILLGPLAVALVLVVLNVYCSDFHPAWSDLFLRAAPWYAAIVNFINLTCVFIYWGALFDKLRSASTADARRRMRVLCAGSIIGLGSVLVIFVMLRSLGIYTPERRWLAYLGIVLFFTFPVALAYVVVVQRAMNLRILLRMGTKYALARATLIGVELAAMVFFVSYLVPLAQRNPQKAVNIFLPLVVVLLLVVLLIDANMFSIRRFFFQESLSARLQRWLDRKFFRENYNAEQVLSELSEQARRFTETGPLLETITRRIADTLHVHNISVLLAGGGVFRLQQAVGLSVSAPLFLMENSSTVRNLKRGGPATLYRDKPDGWFLLADEDERRTLDAMNTELLLPLAGRNRLLGVMALGPKKSEEPYSPSDLRLLQSVSTQTGLALEISEMAHSLAEAAAQRERIHREIEIAREVQERLFPQEIPTVINVTLAGACRPAQGVGGDYYDFIPLENGRLGLAIGDVSGKGISAALLMASLRASLRGMTLDGPKNLAKLMHNVNLLVYEASATNRYATFFFATFDPASRSLHYVNAGHNPPLVLRREAKGTKTLRVGTEGTLRLDTGGPVVGLLPDAPYAEGSVQLMPGDILLAYTDGISEAMNAADAEWGEDKMQAAAESAEKGSADDILHAVFQAADEFTAGASQHDDMTLLVMKLNVV